MTKIPLVAKELPVHIRWMIRADMPAVMAIEQASFATPWSEEEMLKVLRQRNAIGLVAEADKQVVGYMVYELHTQYLVVLDFAVTELLRRHGVGSQMLQKLTGKLSLVRRNRVEILVRETNLPMQLFLRSHGFRAGQVARNFYEDTPEDAYSFQYVLLPEGATRQAG